MRFLVISRHLIFKILHGNFLLLVIVSSVYSQNNNPYVTYEFSGSPGYLDTVRIGVIYNTIINSPCNSGPNGISYCQSAVQTANGLAHIEDSMIVFVRNALSDVNSMNVKISPADNDFNWDVVESWWGADRLPHVIVHINAGWYSCNGVNVESVLSQATQSFIGIVSLGDDAAYLSDIFFGFRHILNPTGPMGGGNTADELWIDLQMNDTVNSQFVVKNAILLKTGDLSAKTARISFKNYNVYNGRCIAEPEPYNISPVFESYIQTLGVQGGIEQGINISDPIGPAEFYDVVTVFEDSTRIAIALAFQPHFLQDRNVMMQLIYDAILYTSNPPPIITSISNKKYLSPTEDIGRQVYNLKGQNVEGNIPFRLIFKMRIE